MSRRGGWPWAALCVALLSSACDVRVGENGLSVDFAAGKATDEWTRTYDLQSGGRLEIVNVNGSIHASPSADSRVNVRAIREARADSDEAARDLLQKMELREEVAPDRVSVQSPEDRGRGGFGRTRLTIRYEVQLPPGLDVMLKTQNGEVNLENIQGQITASSTNGAVTGSGLSGSVNASTVNGGVRVDLESVTGESRMTTVNGGVVLTVAPGLNADLEAGVVNGGVLVQDGLPFAAEERSRQRVAGRLNDGGPLIAVQTTNGGVRVGPR